MTDRKASFAKRQREIDQKERSKEREARRAERRSRKGGVGGPPIEGVAGENQEGVDVAPDDVDNDPNDGLPPPTPPPESDQA